MEEEFIALYVKRRFKDPFAVLVATILSQNTTEKNAFRAWENLVKALNGSVTPERVLELGREKLEEMIRPAGLQAQKARAILEAAKEWKSLERALAEGDDRPFLKIKGIGRKTVDVLFMHYGHKRFPVDTHVKRVAERLGLASGSYEKVSSALSELFNDVEEAHMLLILHGRRICKAKKPECGRCPLRDLCAHAGGLGTTTALTGPSGPGK